MSREGVPIDVKDGIIQEYGRWRLYNVWVFIDDKPEWLGGVDYKEDLDGLLQTLALRFAVSPKQDVAIRIHRFNHGDEKWYHPGGKAMPDDWNGLLPLKVTVNVGSHRIE